MSMKLYVGNLAFQTSSEDLQQLFAQAGTVESASVVEDRETGRSRGFGFVEMSSKEEGAAAIEQFNGKEVNGRNLTSTKPNRARIAAVAAVVAAATAAAVAVVAATAAAAVVIAAAAVATAAAMTARLAGKRLTIPSDS